MYLEKGGAVVVRGAGVKDRMDGIFGNIIGVAV